MSSPYTYNDFFQFFSTLASRLFGGFTGPDGVFLFSDELQLCVLLCISIYSAVVGTFLICRRMAMLANALSHTILAGIVIAYLAYYFLYQSKESFDFQHLLPSELFLIIAAISMALITTALTQASVHLFGMNEDASTGIVFTFLFALGIILVTSFSRNAHVGVELLMGNVDVLERRDLTVSFSMLLANLAIVTILWRALFVTSFDPIFAHLLGFSNTLYGYVVMTPFALFAIGAFRSVGVVLFLAFLVTPALIARLFSDSFKKVIMYSVFVGMFCSIVGVALSRHLLSVHAVSCSTGALIVSILFITYILCLFVKFLLAQRSVNMALSTAQTEDIA